MEHSFSIEHAKKYGVNCAVVLKNLQFWIQKNLANRKHFYEGRVWTYNSVKAFKELFPYFTEKQIRTVLEKLVKDNVVITGNFAKNKTDRTTFYAFVNQQEFLDFTFVEKEVLEALLPFAILGKSILPKSQNDLTERAKGFDSQGKCINTDSKPNNKPDSKLLNTGEFSENENSVFGSETIVKPLVEENPDPVETPAGETGKEGEQGGRPAGAEKPKKEKVKLTNPVPVYPENWATATKKAFDEWLEYRLLIKKPYLEVSLKTQLKKLNVFDQATIIETIEESIAQGWRGLFPKVSKETAKPKKQSLNELSLEILKENLEKIGYNGTEPIHPSLREWDGIE